MSLKNVMHSLHKPSPYDIESPVKYDGSPLRDEYNIANQQKNDFINRFDPYKETVKYVEVYEVCDKAQALPTIAYFELNDKREIINFIGGEETPTLASKLSGLYESRICDEWSYRVAHTACQIDWSFMIPTYNELSENKEAFLIADSYGIYFKNMSDTAKEAFSCKSWYFCNLPKDGNGMQTMEKPFYDAYVKTEALSERMAQLIFNCVYDYYKRYGLPIGFYDKLYSESEWEKSPFFEKECFNQLSLSSVDQTPCLHIEDFVDTILKEVSKVLASQMENPAWQQQNNFTYENAEQRLQFMEAVEQNMALLITDDMSKMTDGFVIEPRPLSEIGYISNEKPTVYPTEVLATALVNGYIKPAFESNKIDVPFQTIHDNVSKVINEYLKKYEKTPFTIEEIADNERDKEEDIKY